MGLEFLEYEENVGRIWHRIVGDKASYPHYPTAGVELEDEKRRLAVFFRGLGGDPALAFGAGAARVHGHRLRMMQRMGVVEERLHKARRSTELVLLPPSLACLPASDLNRDLYTWLTAFLAHARPVARGDDDPLRRDLHALREIDRTVRRLLEQFAGLKALYDRLASALLAQRPSRRLPRAEAAVERLVRHLHGEGDGGELAAFLRPAASLDGLRAPRGYRTFLPAPLWGEVDDALAAAREAQADEEEAAGESATDEEKLHRPAERMENDSSERDALTLINKGELLLATAEMIDVARPDDEENAEDARKAAQDQDSLTLGRPDRPSSSRVKMDLDLASEAMVRDAPTTATPGIRYPEWDWRRGAYRKDYCVVRVAPAAETGEDWRPDETTRRLIRRVRRQFEALRPRRETLRRQLDGDELDMDALVRARTDLLVGGACDDRVHLTMRDRSRDLAVVLLVDISLSSDAWIEGRRVLDVEKEALTALAWGLDACGDAFSILTFTSRRHEDVRISTVKDFDETLGEPVRRRIAALHPGHYTRMGAAIRHASARLAGRHERRRLLLLLSDGKPNDIDHYEGRYGIEDSRKAVGEARVDGTAVFAVTVDRRAENWVPFIFGRGGAAVVGHLGRLPEALPRIYRQVTAT